MLKVGKFGESGKEETGLPDSLLQELASLEPKHATAHDLKQTRIEYERGLDYYRKRLDAIGFSGYSRILDAACGWGQWTLALAEKNDYVSSIDINPGGLEISQAAIRIARLNNAQLCRGDLHFLPFKSASFDAVFCYGALMYTREDLVLTEVARILKPDGRFYICSNGPAWPLYKSLVMGVQQMNLRAFLSGLKIFFQTVVFNLLSGNFSDKLTFIRKRDLVQLLESNHLECEYYGPEGSYGNLDGQAFEALHGKTYFGLPVDFEALGRKDGRR